MLKGKATIELTNVKTGEVETYEEENMITDAIQNILSSNPDFCRDRYAFSTHIHPIYSSTLGGIVLLENECEENPSNIYPDVNNKIVGYSNRSVNTTSDPCRGSFNAAESGFLNPERTSIKYVYDFNTVQGNGTISALALTSNTAGANFFGNWKSGSMIKNNLTQVASSYVYSSYDNNNPYDLNKWHDDLSVDYICSFSIPQNKAYSAFFINTTTLIIKEFKFSFSGASIGDLGASNTRIVDRIIKTRQLSTTNTFDISTMFFPDDYENPSCLWGFYFPNNSSGNATIKWIKIFLNDYSFEEGSWILENKYLRMCGYNSRLNAYNNYGYARSYTYNCKDCILYQNYLYCFNYNRTGIYKISIENPENTIFISSPLGRCYPTYSYSLGGDMNYCAFNIVNGIIYCPEGKIINDQLVTVNWNVTGTFPNDNTTRGLYNCYSPCLKCGPIYFNFRTYSTSTSFTSTQIYHYYTIWMEKDYLATINNLESPIEKTDDKTMKITYILTEVEDEE